MASNELTVIFKQIGLEQVNAKMDQYNARLTKLVHNTNGTVTATGKLNTAIDQQGRSTNNLANATDRASRAQAGYFAHIAKTTIQSALVNKLFLEMVDVLGQAIKQVDLMNNFPATMASMGQSAGDANEALQTMRDYVGQVGGNLGDATSMVTRFTGATGSVKAATAIFVGLNNALIAGDSSLEEQRQAAIQFAQALERGRPDMREWRSLLQNMSFQLQQVATSMGYVNANALGEALTSGEESMAAFTTALTRMSTGTGEIAQQALVRMQGMQFAWNVLKNTMVQGLAAIINAFGRSNIVAFFSFLTQVVTVLAQAVVKLIGWLITLFNLISGLFGGPKLSLAKDAEGVAEGLGAGAEAAGGIKDGLDGAGSSAKKLTKSLAAFDKMNVLPDKESGGGGGGSGGGDGGGGGAGFDPSQLGDLEGLFDGIGGKIQEASKWAKIFAGILGGIAAIKFAQGLANQFNGLIKTIDETRRNLGRLKTAFDNAFKGADKDAEKTGKTLGEKLATGIGKSSSLIGSAISGLITGIGIAIGAAVGPILTAIGGVIAAGAAALGVSVGVFVAIVVAAVAIIVGLIYVIWTNWDTIWGWITTAFQVSWNFIVGLWQQLYDIFAGPIKFILQFVAAVFILIVAIVATALELMFKLVVGTVTGIFNLLATIAGWIFNNVITPVFNLFVALWQGIINIITTAWNFIFNNILKPIGSWISVNVITPVFNIFKGLFNTIIGALKAFISTFYGPFSAAVAWIKANVINPIANFFSGLWDGIKNGLRSMINALGSIFGNLGNVAKAPINALIDTFNSLFRKLNNIKVPDWVPGLGGKSVNFPQIPRLARGGVVQDATLAMIGESGSEAIVPLENNTEWIDKLASKIKTTSDGQPVQLTIQIGEETIATKMIDLINEKTQMSGRNAILV